MAEYGSDFGFEVALAAPGTGTISFGGAAASGLKTLVNAGLDGKTVRYEIFTESKSKWEKGAGLITSGSPTTMTRSPTDSSSGGSLIDWQPGDMPIYITTYVSIDDFAKLRANHRGSSAPANPLQAGMTWADTSAGVTAVAFKYYDGADWITLWTINETANTVSFDGGSLAAGTVANAALANMTAATIKGRISGTGAPQDLTDQQAASLLYVGAKFIAGMTYANNSSDATNDIDIAAGVCHADDASYAYWIELAAITKRLDASWSVGTNQGGLDTGSIANTDYYIWAIARSDTGVTDVLFSTSSTSPTMPANYDYKRLIGWFKRASSTIVPFKTTETAGGGLEFRWITQRLDVDLTNTLTTSRRTDALSVPLNFSTMVTAIVLTTDASANHNEWVGDPSETDAAPGVVSAPLANIVSATSNFLPKQLRIRTSATGTIAARSTLATVDSYKVSTVGWEWSRR